MIISEHSWRERWRPPDPDKDPVGYWSWRVGVHVTEAVKNIILAGEELIQAKACVSHGQFGEVCARVGIERSVASRFMAIARHPVLADGAHVQHLPGSWSTLYELSKMPETDLIDAIETGEINPNTERKHAKALVARSVVKKLGLDGVCLDTPAAEPSFDDRCRQWVTGMSKKMMEGAKLLAEADSMKEAGTLVDLGAHAAMALMIYERISERHLDAEIRALLDADAG